MLTLKDFDKRKLIGLVNFDRENYQISLRCFKDALELDEDPFTYFYLAKTYQKLKEYKNAREAALSAIKSGYDCYELFARISIRNLRDVNNAIKVLNDGVDNRSASACIEMAKLYIDRKHLPDMLDPVKASSYLEKAFEYAPIEKRGLFAYRISKLYKVIYETFPSFIDFKSENSELYYLNIFDSYGGVLLPPKCFNIDLFEVANKNNDYSVIKKLFERFDGDAYFIFSLLLLYEEYKSTGTILITKNYGLFAACGGAIKYNHGGCLDLCSLCYWSDFEGCVFDNKAAINCLERAKQSSYIVPKSLEPFFKELMNHLNSEVLDGTFGHIA